MVKERDPFCSPSKGNQQGSKNLSQQEKKQQQFHDYTMASQWKISHWNSGPGQDDSPLVTSSSSLLSSTTAATLNNHLNFSSSSSSSSTFQDNATFGGRGSSMNSFITNNSPAFGVPDRRDNDNTTTTATGGGPGYREVSLNFARETRLHD